MYKQNRYSCPYQYSKKKVDLKITDRFVEIYYKGERLTTHNRFPDYMKNKYSTHPEDMPPAFRNIVQRDDKRIRNWASSVGKSTRQVVDRILGSVSIKEQGNNPCLAVLRLSRTYTDARLETACELAVSRGIKVPLMLNDETKRKLRLLNVGEFIEELEIQQQDPQTLALSFDDRFQLLTESVYERRYNNKVRRLI